MPPCKKNAMSIFADELECLRSSFDPKEFEYIPSNKSQILKFMLQNNVSVTFEVVSTYPEKPPSISILTELTNAERSLFENELRHLADKRVGNPMIMDLVIKLQQLIQDYYENNKLRNDNTNIYGVTEETEIPYLTVILIDHMRQKRKYCNTLLSWAAELSIQGCLMFYQRWIFLFLQGSKRQIKEFTTRHRSVCIDVDSSGRACKEKMAKILFEGLSSAKFADFSMKEMSSLNDVEIYFEKSNISDVYKEIIQPILVKNKSTQ